MAQAVGLVLVVLFIAGTAGFAAHIYRAAKAEGLLPLPRVPKLTGGPSARTRAQRARKQAVRGGRTVSVIAAEAITTNWLARKAHQREQAAKAPADSPSAERRPLLHRLVVPGSTQAPGTPAAIPAQPAKPAPSPNGQPPGPSPTSSGGTPMTTPATGTSAGDFMSATTRIIAEAEAGGLQSKIRGGLVMGEGLKQLAAAMAQHAKHLQDNGQYPAYVWEPWTQAAALAHAAASKTTEAGNAAAELAGRPMGEANGQAPHRDELNKR